MSWAEVADVGLKGRHLEIVCLRRPQKLILVRYKVPAGYIIPPEYYKKINSWLNCRRGERSSQARGEGSYR